MAAHLISRDVSDVTAARAAPTAVADDASSELLLPREGQSHAAASNATREKQKMNLVRLFLGAENSLSFNRWHCYGMFLSSLII